MNVLDSVLGTTAKVQLLRLLVPAQGPMTGREARRMARVRSVRGAQMALRELTELGVLERERRGNAFLYRANHEHVLFPALEALFKAEQDRIQALGEELDEALERVGLRAAVISAHLVPSTLRGKAGRKERPHLLVVAKTIAHVESVSDTLLAVGHSVQTRLWMRPAVTVLPRREAVTRYQRGDTLLRAAERGGRPLLGSPIAEIVAA